MFCMLLFVFCLFSSFYHGVRLILTLNIFFVFSASLLKKEIKKKQGICVLTMTLARFCHAWLWVHTINLGKCEPLSFSIIYIYIYVNHFQYLSFVFLNKVNLFYKYTFTLYNIFFIIIFNLNTSWDETFFLT